MIKMIFSRTIFFLLFFLASTGAIAQEAATIKSSVDKNRILLGEPFQLTIEVSYPVGTANLFTGIDSIPHFESLDTPVVDSGSSGSTTTIKSIYTITSFDSGHWVIPAFIFSKTVKTDTIPIDVVFSEFDPKQPYHDIKDILEVEPAKKKQWWWYAAGGLLLLALLLIWLLRKKKKPVVPKLSVVIDPFEDALQQLVQLEKEKPAAKIYHTRLGEIFRLYVYRKKGILSLQKTTDDLILQIQNLGLNKEEYQRISQALRLGDFVKFAKYIPSQEDDKAALETVRRSIEEIQRISKEEIQRTS
ncbi:MAG: BatD family protein [Chitinophagaceae bacterium]